MKPCPCGCGRPVQPGRTYGWQGCYLRVNRERARAMGLRGGREGARTRLALHRMRLLDRFRHLDRDDAIVAAWAAGIASRKRRDLRARKAGKAANAA